MAKTSSPDVLADDRITQFGLLVEANRRLIRTIEDSLRAHHGLAMVEFEAMVRLGRSPERQMSMSELADQMVLTSGGVTRLVDRLAKEDWVERVSCPSDRRVHWARLTDKGVETVSAALTTHLQDLDDHYFGSMSAEEQTTVSAVLGRLRTTSGD
jgi:DNA-binding MarR family transcriptional regulator